jgi:glutamyl-Q tRNA(Asp) synthetase
LHFGSAVAAIGSYVQARAARGRWLVRIDDIDPPREEPGAAASILRALDRLGLGWDGPVYYQSQRQEAYQEALEKLRTAGLTYTCGCSRKAIGRGPYPGTCRNGPVSTRNRRSVRVRTTADPITFSDRLQGDVAQSVETEVGDFVVKRSDGLLTYHLATVVDDAWHGITEVVRGVDLIESTPRQIHLQRLLAVPQPGYGHLPAVLDMRGMKLGKQTGAPGIDDRCPDRILYDALRFLGHTPPAEMRGAAVETLLAWAICHWNIERVPRASYRPNPSS